MLHALIFLLFSPLYAEELAKACEVQAWSEDSIEERRRQLLNGTCQDQESDLFVFVSSSLHRDHLLELGKEAQEHGGVLVFKGLVGNSFKETVRTLRFLFEENIGVLIDPQLFEDYRIHHLPAFVLTNGKQADSLSGSVSISYALKTFSAKGDLRQDAQWRIK